MFCEAKKRWQWVCVDKKQAEMAETPQGEERICYWWISKIPASVGNQSLKLTAVNLSNPDMEIFSRRATNEI